MSHTNRGIERHFLAASDISAARVLPKTRPVMLACSITRIDSPVYLRCMGMPGGVFPSENLKFKEKLLFLSSHTRRHMQVLSLAELGKPYRDRDTSLFRFIDLTPSTDSVHPSHHHKRIDHTQFRDFSARKKRPEGEIWNPFLFEKG